MFKVLLKKQFMELFKSYFINPKTGKARTKNGIIGMFVLFAFLLGICGFAFFGMGVAIAGAMAEADLDWLYFALFGILGTLLGLFGSVFNTFAALYKAKDNDLLLSLPIKPVTILTTRIFSVYALSLLYESILFLPATVCYWIYGRASVGTVIFPIIMDFVLALFISAFTCIFGWIIAIISSKLKSKKIITALISVAFIGGYYYLNSKIGTYLMLIAEKADEIGKGVNKYAYLYYSFGKAASGNILHFLLFTAISAVCFGIVLFVLSRSYIKLTTTTKSEKKKKKDLTSAKQSSVSKALLGKEIKRFTSSTAYMMNCGLGLIIMPVMAVAALFKGGMLNDVLTSEFSDFAFIMPVLCASVLCVISSMNCITAPSISLEGKNLWLAKSMPVETKEILKAKIKLQIVLASVPIIITGSILGYVLTGNIIQTVLITCIAWVYNAMCARTGLLLNLRFPNLNWTNETQPIKSSLPVFISLFGGWVVSLIPVGIYFLLQSIVPCEVFLGAELAVFAVCCLILDKLIATKGVKMFMEL